MRRRATDDQSSLELLLDTITNTFGGVLFIAILIAILLQLSGRIEREAPQPVPQAELIALRQQLADAQAALGALRAAVEAQEQVAADFSPQALSDQAREVEALEQQRDALRTKRLALLEQLSGLHVESGAIAAELERLAAEQATVAEAVRQAEAALRSEVEQRSVAGRLPKTRPTYKREVACLVRHGRLYSYFQNPPQRMVESPVAERVNQGRRAPEAGLALASSRIKEELARLLKDCSPRSEYIALAIWTDSFAQFVPLRRALVEMGYEYRLILMDPDESVRLGGTGNPQVQ